MSIQKNFKNNPPSPKWTRWVRNETKSIIIHRLFRFIQIFHFHFCSMLNKRKALNLTVNSSQVLTFHSQKKVFQFSIRNPLSKLIQHVVAALPYHSIPNKLSISFTSFRFRHSCSTFQFHYIANIIVTIFDVKFIPVTFQSASSC